MLDARSAPASPARTAGRPAGRAHPGRRQRPVGRQPRPGHRPLPRRRRAAASGSRPSASGRTPTVVGYCGSGVSACADLLALERAGVGAPASTCRRGRGGRPTPPARRPRAGSSVAPQCPTPTSPPRRRDRRRADRPARPPAGPARRRIAGIEWFEALYRAYLTGGVGLVVVLFLSSWVGDDQVTGVGWPTCAAWPGRHRPRRRAGPRRRAALGQPGRAAGPREAEVRYVLLAPVDRRRALLRRRCRSSASPPSRARWSAPSPASWRPAGWRARWAVGGQRRRSPARSSACSTRRRLMACGLRLPRWLATGRRRARRLGGRRPGRAVPSPFAAIGTPGRLAARAGLAGRSSPSRSSIGLRPRASLLGRLSLGGGRAPHRAGRPAALRGDGAGPRTVMVLRRQLVQEQHRTRPWFRLPRSRARPSGAATCTACCASRWCACSAWPR